jgi:hypothetical protein
LSLACQPFGAFDAFRSAGLDAFDRLDSARLGASGNESPQRTEFILRNEILC